MREGYLPTFLGSVFFLLAGAFASGIGAQESTPDFVYSLSPCPQSIAVAPGHSAEMEFECVLTTTNHEQPPVAEGAVGWSFSLLGDDLTVIDVTTDGTAAALQTDDPPGLRNSASFNRTELIRGGLEECDGRREGAVGSVLLYLHAEDRVTLPPEGPSVLARVRVRVDASERVGETTRARLAYVDSCQGSGGPIANLVVWRVQTVPPRLENCEFSVVAVEPQFRRGDTNGDGVIDVSDAVFLLNWLVSGGEKPSCLDAADVNDSSAIDPDAPDLVESPDISDVIYFLNWLFLGGRPPPAPGHLECGPDPTEDNLSCVSFDPCA